MNVTLVIVGVVLCLIGLAMLGKSQSGGLSLQNLGVNFGSTNTQKIGVDGGADGDKKAKFNWVGLVIAVIGLITAAVGLFKALRSP